MRVPVAPPSSSPKSWGSKKKEDDSNIPAWKQKLKSTKPSSEPALPTWKQKLKSSNHATTAAATAAAGGGDGGAAETPAWKQKLKPAVPISAASSSEPAWKAKLKSTKPSEPEPVVPAWKAKLKSTSIHSVTSSNSGSVPAWKANIKSTESESEPEPTTEEPPTEEQEQEGQTPQLSATDVADATEPSDQKSTSSTNDNDIDNDNDSDAHKEEQGTIPDSAKEKDEHKASFLDDSDNDDDDEEDCDDDSSSASGIGKFNFYDSSSSSSNDDDDDVNDSSRNGRGIRALGISDDDDDEVIIVKNELDYDKRVSQFFQAREKIRVDEDGNEIIADEMTDTVAIDGDAVITSEATVVDDTTAAAPTDESTSSSLIFDQAGTDENPSLLAADHFVDYQQEESDSESDVEEDAGVDMVAMEVEKLKMQQQLMSIEDDLDSEIDSIQEEEENWMVSAAPVEDDGIPQIDYMAILQKTAAQRKSQESHNDNSNSHNLGGSTASLGLGVAGGSAGGNEDDAGGVFCARIDDLEHIDDAEMHMSLGNLEIDAVQGDENDELPIDTWMLNVNEDDAPDVDYAAILDKLGEDEEDDEYKVEELTDTDLPQFKFDVEQSTQQALEMARMAQDFDKTIDATQEDMKATTNEFINEATHITEEGFEYKHKLTAKIGTGKIEYSAEKDPDLEGKHRNLMVLMHGSKCQVMCKFPFCKASKMMMQHISSCTDRHCRVPYCPGSKYVSFKLNLVITSLTSC